MNVITLVAGPCAVRSENQTMSMAYNIAQIGQITQKYGIEMEFRAGAWKPRTRYTNGTGEKVFEGLGKEGLRILDGAAKEYGLPIVTELMDSNDLSHFLSYLEPIRDTAQVGARTGQTYALLAHIGLSPFNVLLKNPQHGVDIEEAIGSLERITHPSKDAVVLKAYKKITVWLEKAKIKNPNKRIVYCVRGQKRPVYVQGTDYSSHAAYLKALNSGQNQHPDSRNLNNIGAIELMKNHKFFKEHNIRLFYDPSHVFGGKTNVMRRLIGEQAIKAITEFGYDGLEIEVDDRSAEAITDKDQALVTTYNRINFPQTNMVREPAQHEIPLSLVDIVKTLMAHQVTSGFNVHPGQFEKDNSALDKIIWGIQQ